jgi:hypothetical protein
MDREDRNKIRLEWQKIRAETIYSRPIPVTQQLPPNGVSCLVFEVDDYSTGGDDDLEGVWIISLRSANQWYENDKPLQQSLITHWLPLPAAPNVSILERPEQP